MAKVTIRKVIEVLKTSDAPRRPTASDIADLLNERIRRRAVERALRKAIKKGLVLQLGKQYRLAYQSKSPKWRNRQTSRAKRSCDMRRSEFSRLPEYLSPSKDSGASRLVHCRDSLELNKQWFSKKCSSELEQPKDRDFKVSFADNATVVIPAVDEQGSSVASVDPVVDSLTVKPAIIEAPKKNYWSFLRFW